MPRLLHYDVDLQRFPQNLPVVNILGNFTYTIEAGMIKTIIVTGASRGQTGSKILRQRLIEK